jgi:hypothetical protein
MTEPKPQNDLYAAALETYDAKGEMINGTIVYTHAPDSRTAEVSFRAMYSRELITGRRRIASVGLAIGFEVADEHGEVLIAR